MSVLDLSRPSFAVILCCARPAVLDLINSRESAACGRVAADELLLLVPRDDSARVLAEIVEELQASDPGAIAIDHSDAFHLLTLSGPFREAMARLTAIDLPESGFLQGLAAGVPCKMFVRADRVCLLAPSTYADHVRERIFATCGDLGIRELAQGEPRAAEPATSA